MTTEHGTAEPGSARAGAAGAGTLPETLDRRTHAWHEGRGVVEPALAAHFPELRPLTPLPMQSGRGSLTLRAAPDAGAAQVTEALLGEPMTLLEPLAGGWSWVRCQRDGYLGYARTEGLEPPSTGPRVNVTVPRAQLFSAPRVSAPVLAHVGLLCAPTLLDPEPQAGGDYWWWRVAYRGGEAFLHAAATAPLPDLTGPGGLEAGLALLTRYLDAPYTWGGRSAWGLDCSGLTGLYLTLISPDHPAPWPPRDADQQRAALTPVEVPRAGDLAYFKGHTGLMLDARRMLHANATHMRVTVETLGEGEYGGRLAAGLLGYGRVPRGGGE